MLQALFKLCTGPPYLGLCKYNIFWTIQERSLEKEMATHSSILACRIPGTEEPGGLPSMGSHGVGHNWSDLAAAAGSITMNKVSGVDGIPIELFQILKYNAVKVLHSLCQQTWKTQQWPQDWKRSVFIPIPKKGNAKKFSNFCAIAFISHTSKAWPKSLKLGFNSMNQELTDV